MHTDHTQLQPQEEMALLEIFSPVSQRFTQLLVSMIFMLAAPGYRLTVFLQSTITSAIHITLPSARQSLVVSLLRSRSQSISSTRTVLKSGRGRSLRRSSKGTEMLQSQMIRIAARRNANVCILYTLLPKIIYQGPNCRQPKCNATTV